MRKRGEFAAGARQQKRPRNGHSASAGGGANTAGVAIADRGSAAFAGGRNRGRGDSVLHQGAAAANRAGQFTAAERSFNQLAGLAVRATGIAFRGSDFRTGTG